MVWPHKRNGYKDNRNISIRIKKKKRDLWDDTEQGSLAMYLKTSKKERTKERERTRERKKGKKLKNCGVGWGI